MRCAFPSAQGSNEGTCHCGRPLTSSSLVPGAHRQAGIFQLRRQPTRGATYRPRTHRWEVSSQATVIWIHTLAPNSCLSPTPTASLLRLTLGAEQVNSPEKGGRALEKFPLI